VTDRTSSAGATPEFAQRAEDRRLAGDAEAAERIVRAGLADQPENADAVLLLARVLLEQDRGSEALGVIEQYASLTRLPGDEAAQPDGDGPVFGEAVSEAELELAFEDAQPEREQMVDADSIAQQAIRQTDTDLSGDFASPEVSYATETVAGLLEDQGAEPEAMRIREVVATERATPTAQTHSHAAIIQELERWLGNLRGGMQA
jgi:hypothetical protein